MSIWDRLKQVLSDAYHVLGLLNPGGGSKPGGDQDAIRAAAKVWGEQYRTLSDISSLLDSTVMTHLRSGAVPAGTGPIGVAQAWNDPAGDMFQSYWRNVKAGIDRSASAFNQMPGALNEVAQHVQGFNNSVNSLRGQLEWWIGITGVLVALGFVTEGGTDVIALTRFEQGSSLVANGIKLLTAALKLYDFFTATLKQEFIIFGVRMVERWVIAGDPSAGWSKYDPVQIPIFGGLLAVFNKLSLLVDEKFWAPRVTDPMYALAPSLEQRLLGLSGWQQAGRNLVWRPVVSVTQNLTWNNLQAHLITHARNIGHINATNIEWVTPTGLAVGLVGLARPTLSMKWSTTGMVALNTSEEIINPSLRVARAVYIFPATKDLGRVQPALFQPTPAGLMPIGTLPVHRVAPGDNLWNLAQQQYGNGLEYQDLAEANRIQNPNLIYPGQFLTLPGVPLPPATRGAGNPPDP